MFSIVLQVFALFRDTRSEIKSEGHKFIALLGLEHTRILSGVQKVTAARQ